MLCGEHYQVMTEINCRVLEIESAFGVIGVLWITTEGKPNTPCGHGNGLTLSFSNIDKVLFEAVSVLPVLFKILFERLGLDIVQACSDKNHR
jgi:hypothetical protein